MTEVALKEHLENLVEALRREVIALREGDTRALDLARREFDAKREGDDRALDLARRELDARLKAMNEFRDQIQEERRDYVRVDTFKWTVGFIVSLIAAACTVVKLWR